LRPSSPRPAAFGPVAALLSLLVAGCAHPEADPCPGEVFAALALHGTLSSSGCVAPPSSGWSVPATLPDVAPTSSDPVPTFAADFSWDAAKGQLAYCTDVSHAAVLLGTRTGDHLQAGVSLEGAVLSSCAATCAPLFTLVVEGDLTHGSNGGTLMFKGTLTETLDDSPGPCGECVLPCTSVYDLTGESR
jgi:hypothetical protein